MNFDTAQKVKINDTVYDCFMDEYKVVAIEYDLSNHDELAYKLIFTLKDSHNFLKKFNYEDLYLKDLAYEDEEEKSWVNWAKDNKDFFGEFDHLSTIKAIYKHAFAEGFNYKRRCSYQEMMQK